ncbi:MAG: glycosyl hydrolase family 18 protein, partial [Dehalococcoidia bacterium]|nr:glycosyl hydrolase family 18 protein [Dehalococcoidia bacterium]
MRTLCLALLCLIALLPLVAGPSPAASQPAPSAKRWIYVHSFSPENLAILRQRITEVDMVSPVFFEVQATGDVTGRDRPEIRQIIGRHPVKLLPMVSNAPRYQRFSPVLNDPALRRRAIDRLVALVVEHGYDGLNIDFEALESADRAGLTQFMVELTARLRPLGKLSTAAVAAKTRDLTTGWAGAYDYAALGAASDYLVLMTYAYRTVDDAPGSTAPMGWVQRTVDFAASVVPPEKLLLGIGLWGYDWNLSRNEPAAVRTWRDIEELAKRPGAQFGYDTVDESAFLLYRSDTGAQRVVWFEDQRAITAKLRLIPAKRLGGWAGWRLGQEGPYAWAAFAALSGGRPVPTPSLPPNNLSIVTALATALAQQSRPAPERPELQTAPSPATTANPARAIPVGALDWAIPGGRFFTQRGAPNPNGGPRLGFAVTDDSVAQFWTAFQRYGGVDGLGYPISDRFVWNGFVTQAFQKAVLQWAPARQDVNFVNVFDELSKAGKDDWLRTVRSTPRALPSSFDDGKTWDQIVAARLALLDEQPQIRRAYYAATDPLRLYGLPVSAVEDNRTHTVVRFQRAVMQYWKDDVPWARAGTVTIANGG